MKKRRKAPVHRLRLKNVKSARQTLKDAGMSDHQFLYRVEERVKKDAPPTADFRSTYLTRLRNRDL